MGRLKWKLAPLASLKVLLDTVKRNSGNKSKTNWLLDFVRLNIVAHRP